MNTTAANTDWPLRVARATTGTVHAAREVQHEILDFDKPAGERGTGRFKTVIVKACGFDPNTFRTVAGTGTTEAPVTCKKCLKLL
jgi:hypothetical protein